MDTPALNLQPGDRYVVGDPADPKNWVTVTGNPYQAAQKSRFHTRTTDMVVIPVRTHDGTQLFDMTLVGATVNTTPPA